MIKKLFFTAALLAPGLAYAGNPSADLSVQVVPVGPPGTTCDYGPTYTGAVPAPAQKAGFNHCVLNADFTTSTFNNINQFIQDCGAAPVNNMVFRWEIGGAFGANCARVEITTDGSTPQVLRLQFQPGDFAAYGNNFAAFAWPASEWSKGPCINTDYCGGGPNGTGLTDFNYVEMTFRIPGASLAASNFTADSSLLDFWQDQCNGCAHTGYYSDGNLPEPEIDFFETHSNYLLNGGTSMPLIGSCNGVPLNPPSNCPYADVTNYHTYGFLTTGDGTAAGNVAQCVYIDGVIQVSPCVNYTVFGKAPYTRFTNGKIIALFLTPQNCFSTTGCDTANFDIYVKSIRVFSCANNWNAVCLTNPIIQSSLGQKLKSWASLAGGIISSLWVTPAQAQTVNDSFEGHFRGLWRCPDGHWGYAIMCEPAEFRGKKWWEGCLPQRSDCIWSNTAFLGQNVDGPYIPGKMSFNYAIRGPGYCYKQQPFTCSPDGKLPQ